MRYAVLQSERRAVVYSSFKQEITGGSLKGTIEPRGEYTVEVEVANWQQFVKILSVELGVIALVCLAGAFVPAKKKEGA